jgi:homoserine O-acetyltransferase
MNASVEPFPRDPGRAATRIPVTRASLLELPGEFPLHHGGALRDVRIAWRLTGAAAAPIVCALGGISATRRVCRSGADELEGWWDEIVGPGKPLDPREFRVLSFDFLGGSGESTGPEAGDFPSISTYDQAEALARLLQHLQIPSLHAIAGGSYGGMVGLAFAERHPECVARLLTIGAADRAHPMATAWRTTQRRIVRFAVAAGDPGQGLELARSLAMTTYRSAEEFSARFHHLPSRDGGRFVFPVERYLETRGRDFAARNRAGGFLCLSESIDLHAVAAARIGVPTTVVAVREDQLVPLADMRAMAARLPHATLQEISSVYGHDAFLKETELLRPIFLNALRSAT